MLDLIKVSCNDAVNPFLDIILSFSICFQVSGPKSWTGQCIHARWWRSWTGATAPWKCPSWKTWLPWPSAMLSPHKRYTRRWDPHPRTWQQLTAPDNHHSLKPASFPLYHSTDVCGYQLPTLLPSKMRWLHYDLMSLCGTEHNVYISAILLIESLV